LRYQNKKGKPEKKMFQYKRIWLILLSCALFLTGMEGCGSRMEQTAPDTTPNTSQNSDSPSLGETVLTFIHVGKGDALLLQVPDGGYYMVDTGKKKDYEEIQQVLELKGVTELQGIFISHGHRDHAGGLERILEEYPVERVYLSAHRDASFEKVDAAAVAEEQGVAVEKLQLGDVLTLGEEGQGVQVEVLGPAQPDEENENNNSLILRVVYGDTAFLLMGDTEEASEERLMDSGAELEADVLKLGHHGKMDATSEELLERVKPSYGIVTANREKEEGSADPRMAERLRDARVQVFYSEGKIRGVDFISDGTKISVKKY
jgi:competence protein ComEC